MKYHQRDVVEINFPIPGGGYKVHPAIIISNDELQDVEGIVYVVLISSKDYAFNRQYSYALNDDMLSFQLVKPSWVKCHLMATDVTEGVLRRLGTIKKRYFNEIVDKTIASIF